MSCFCIVVSEKFEGQDYKEIDDVLSKMKCKKLFIKKEFVEKFIKMVDELEQQYYSKTARGKYTTGIGGKRLVKWMSYYERFYEKNKLICLNVMWFIHCKWNISKMNLSQK